MHVSCSWRISTQKTFSHIHSLQFLELLAHSPHGRPPFLSAPKPGEQLLEESLLGNAIMLSRHNANMIHRHPADVPRAWPDVRCLQW